MRRFVDGELVQPALELPAPALGGHVAPRGDVLVHYVLDGSPLARRFDPDSQTWQEPSRWPGSGPETKTVAIASSANGTFWSVHKQTLPSVGESLWVQRWPPGRVPRALLLAATAERFADVAIAADDSGRAVLVYEAMSRLVVVVFE